MSKPKSRLILHLDGKESSALTVMAAIEKKDFIYVTRAEGRALGAGVHGLYLDLRSIVLELERENEELRRRLDELERRLPEQIGRET